MLHNYEFKQGVLVAIKDPSDNEVVTDGPHTEDLSSHGLPFTIYPGPSLRHGFPYKFACTLTVAHIEHCIWVADLPELLALLNTLHVTLSISDLPDAVHQANRIMNGFALLPVNIVKDSRPDAP